MAGAKKKKSKANLIFMLGLLMATPILSAAVYIPFKEKLELEAQTQEIVAQIEEQQRINDDLKKQMDYKDSDQYIEKIAREQLNMVKANEIVFIDKNK